MIKLSVEQVLHAVQNSFYTDYAKIMNLFESGTNAKSFGNFY